MKINYERGIAVFCSVLIVFALFNFALVLNSEEVVAANVDTCGLTEDGNYCVEVGEGESIDDYDGCVAGHWFPGAWREDVEECNVGYCVPSGPGQCLSNVEQIRCTNENGAFYDVEPADCQVGCCRLHSSDCGLQEGKVCRVDLGGEWTGPSDDAQECNLQCPGATLGCYKSAIGFCDYGLLEYFQGQSDFDYTNFLATDDPVTGPFCSDLVGCPSYGNGHAYLSCGDDTTDDDEWDVYWYDREDNREDLSESCGPSRQCYDADGQGGEFNAECVTTDCIEDCPDCYPSTLKSGESVCVNVLEGFFANDRVSRYLENYQLNCQNRKITPDFGDYDGREFLCEERISEDGRFNAYPVDNEWESCADCGDGGPDLLDLAGYVPILGQGILGLAGSSCGMGFGNGETCGDIGDCDYDRDLWPPIGSCNPNYPPSTIDECGACGDGGDEDANLCTMKECNALGDCVFVEEGGAGYGAAAGLALGTFTSCMATGAVVWFIPWLGGPAGASGMWDLCLASVTQLGGGQLLFWGIVSTIYGAAARTGTQDVLEYDLSDQIIHNGKIKTGYALVSSKSFLEDLDPEAAQELFEGINLDNGGDTPSFEIAESVMLNGVLSAIIAPFLAGSLNAILSSSVTFANVEGAFSVFLLQAGFETVIGETFVAPAVLVESMVAVGLLVQYVTLAESFQTGNCYPEDDTRALTTSEACSDCGVGEGQWYCTEDRCNILGGHNEWCQYISFGEDESTGIEDGLCLPNEPYNDGPPSIESVSAEFFDFDRISLEGPYEESDGSLVVGTIPWETMFAEIKLETSEEAECSYSMERDANVSDGIFFEFDETILNHNLTIQFADADRIRDQTHIYFKCRDFVGAEMDPANNENYVLVEFGERPDQEPPTIDYISPPIVAVPNGTESVELQLFAYDNNGVGDCRYSKENGTSYVDMTGFGLGEPVPCVGVDDTCTRFSTVFDLTEEGWGFEIEGFEGVVHYPLYILCADEADPPNVMYEPYPWWIEVWPTFDVIIDSPLEDEEIYGTDAQVTVSTSVDSFCDYTLSSGLYSTEGNFSESFGMIHDEFISDLEGSPGGEEYALEVTCTDYAGNEVIESLGFEIVSDVYPPRLLRIYTANNRLNIVLDEEASCVYSTEELEEGPMIGSGFTHSADLDSNSVRYEITCTDTWDNEVSYVIYP